MKYYNTTEKKTKSGLSKQGLIQDLSQANRLMKISEECELWKTPASICYASIKIENHTENYELDGITFKNWLNSRYYQEFKSAPSTNAQRDALATIKAMALHGSEVHDCHLRVAHIDGKVILDIGDGSWGVIEISADKIRILEQSPVKFRRDKKMRPLPIPNLDVDPKIAIEKLKKYLNCECDNDFKLAVSFLISCFSPVGGLLVLVLNGEQGSGKSTFMDIVRTFIDPNQDPRRKAPKNSDDLMITSQNNYLVCFDNISFLSDEISDDLCRLVYGTGYSKRKLFTDNDEIVLSAKRPVILNGIDNFSTRGDLNDRSISIILPRLDESIDEQAFWSDFRCDQSEIFGAICLAIQSALRVVDMEKLPFKIRMGDAFKWISRAEQIFGWPKFATVKAYQAAQMQMDEALIESNLLFSAIREIAGAGFEGTSRQLLMLLRQRLSNSPKAIPPNEASLGSKLRRIAPTLRRVGTDVEFRKANGMRWISMKSKTDT